jgi:GNAT superfamily N-acetyltransferase
VTETSIRDAREDDAEQFVRAYELSWDATLADIAGAKLDTFVPFETRIESFRAGLREASPDARILVAERAGQIVGLATFRCEGETSELRALYVVPGAWGTGIAAQLMRAALSAMRERGAQEAFLWVVEENGRARRFYEREGWIADGELRDSSMGAREVRYGLELGD